MNANGLEPSVEGRAMVSNIFASLSDFGSRLVALRQEYGRFGLRIFGSGPQPSLLDFRLTVAFRQEFGPSDFRLRIALDLALDGSTQIRSIPNLSEPIRGNPNLIFFLVRFSWQLEPERN